MCPNSLVGPNLEFGSQLICIVGNEFPTMSRSQLSLSNELPYTV